MSSPKIGPVTAMEAELDKLRKEANQLNNDYLRSLAEFDNFRKRKERELGEFREFANEQLLQELIPIMDNFERAVLAAEKMTGAAEDAGGCEQLRKGIKLILTQLKATLAKFGFQEYSCLGETFDPRRCEAVNFLERDDKPDNTIVSETAKGYLYRSKVLRPAMVVVAKAPSVAIPEPSASAGERDEAGADGSEPKAAKSAKKS